MLTTSKKLQCRYSVVKYVPDHVRDEPVNIGVLVESVDNRHYASEFITRFSTIKAASEPPLFLRGVVEKIKNRNARGISLDEMETEYSRKIRLSPPRSISVDDLHKDTRMLFSKFISIKVTSKKPLIPIITTIRRHAWNIIKESKKNPKRRNLIRGKNSSFVFDFSYRDWQPRFLHMFSFDSTRALQLTKLFDWSVSDITEKKDYDKSSFHPLLLKPRKKHPAYTASIERYLEAVKILKSKEYQVTCVDENEIWQDKIEQLVLKV